jgi:hypothetical protein
MKITIEHKITPCGNVPASLISKELEETLIAKNHLEINFERDSNGIPYSIDPIDGVLKLVASDYLSADEGDFSELVRETYERELIRLNGLVNSFHQYINQ